MRGSRYSRPSSIDHRLSGLQVQYANDHEPALSEGAPARLRHACPGTRPTTFTSASAGSTIEVQPKPRDTSFDAMRQPKLPKPPSRAWAHRDAAFAMR